jgi:hypothetical protein
MRGDFRQALIPGQLNLELKDGLLVGANYAILQDSP